MLLTAACCLQVLLCVASVPVAVGGVATAAASAVLSQGLSCVHSGRCCCIDDACSCCCGFQDDCSCKHITFKIHNNGPCDIKPDFQHLYNDLCEACRPMTILTYTSRLGNTEVLAHSMLICRHARGMPAPSVSAVIMSGHHQQTAALQYSLHNSKSAPMYAMQSCKQPTLLYGFRQGIQCAGSVHCKTAHLVCRIEGVQVCRADAVLLGLPHQRIARHPHRHTR